jgi:hypothetical protein
MILRAGYQSFDLRRPFEIPRPLIFQSRDEALKWLRQLDFLHSQTMTTLREFIGRFSNDPERFRLTDQEALQQMAELLYARKAVVVARQERTSSGSPSQTQPIPVAFPLSERASRRSTTSTTTSSPAPAEDQPTFDSKLDAVAQASALVAAAKESLPFCPE